jgi:hypothetical protein
MNDALLVAVHAQLLEEAVTFTLPVVTPKLTVWLDDEIEKLQGAFTVTVPTIPKPQWIWQLYGKVPAVVKVKLKVCPGDKFPESQIPSRLQPEPLVTVCTFPPLLVQSTVSPTLTVRSLGLKKSSPRDTFTVAPWEREAKRKQNMMVVVIFTNKYFLMTSLLGIRAYELLIK